MIQSTLKCLLGTCAYFLLCSVLSAPELFAQPCTLISGNISLGGSAHDPGIQFSDPARTSASLSNGNFVIAWETRNGVDGDGNGAYFQVFNADGTTITTVIMPYSDINPSGIGDQGVAGPKIIALTSGFVIAWESENGPGDTGPMGDDQQDVCMRVYNNDGMPLSGTTRLSVVAEEDHLEYLLPLNSGGFVVLIRTDKDVVGDNKDDFYFQAFNANGIATSGPLLNISGGLHNQSFQSIDGGQAMADLGNGNFVVSWESREGIDGNGNGAFFRIFNASGSPVSGVIMPYADINPNGIGDQGTPGPIVLALANGNFVVSWESEQGPGDIGPGPDDQQDIYSRIYAANGTPVTATFKMNSDNSAEEEHLEGTILLKQGNFAVLYFTDKDEIGNTDDLYVRTFSQNGTPAGPSVEVSSGAHLNAFCVMSQFNKGFIALNNGNFAIGWGARDGADGSGDGAYCRVFTPTGAAASAVIMPYMDINPSGIGDQASFGPILKALPDGFTIVWDSEQGPGDVGPAPDDMQDIYHRVMNNIGTPLCGTVKTNASNELEEEILLEVLTLANGNFVVMYRDDEDDTGNLDDLFIRVIGGAPMPVICPTMGTATVSSANVCIGLPFSITVNGLQNMANSANNDRDYGIKLVSFPNASANPYIGGTLLGTIPFANLSSGGSTAILMGVTSNTPDPDLFIYAILDATPGDPACAPFAQTVIAINDYPSVAFSGPSNLCINTGVQTSGGATPSGGMYSGTGVTDNGDGMTYTFDPALAGVGTHLISYNYTSPAGCSGSASAEVTVFALPNVSIALPDTIFVMNGVPPLNVPGGGLPVGGVYTDMFQETADDGNGLTFSFLSNFFIGDTNVITYTFTDVNGCSNFASKTIFVADATVGTKDLQTLRVSISPNPTTGIIQVQGVQADRIEVLDVLGSVLLAENNPDTTLNISGLSSGVYFLRILVGNRLVVEQVVKE